jgi:hypothetical protein
LAPTYLAVKIVDGTQVVARANPDTGAVEFNVPTAKVFQPGDANWFVPDVVVLLCKGWRIIPLCPVF